VAIGARRLPGVRGAAVALAFVGTACQPVVTTSSPPPSANGAPTAVPTALSTHAPGANTSAPLATPAPSLGQPALSPRPGQGTWRQLADFPAGRAFGVVSVARFGGGFIAVGSEPLPGDSYYGLRQGVIWRSDDGLVWDRSADAAFEHATLAHVVALDDAAYVFGQLSTCPLVIGTDCVDSPAAGWQVWRTDDGQSWAPLSQSTEMRQAVVDGVISGDGLLVAYGSSTPPELSATVWLSNDGQAWQPVRPLAGLDPVTAMAASGEGYVALGSQFVPELDGLQALAAHSPDGRLFRAGRIEPGLGVVFESVAAGEDGFVAVGTADSADEGLTPVAIRSGDGTTWTEATSTPSLDGGFHRVHALPSGFVALGFVRAENDDRELGRTWLSTDGADWRPAGDLPGAAYQELGGSALSDRGIVVFATDAQDSENDVETTISGWFARLDRLASGE
jgi:hypothetical protein